jgi:phage terminase large subunit GpA-like protein
METMSSVAEAKLTEAQIRNKQFADLTKMRVGLSQDVSNKGFHEDSLRAVKWAKNTHKNTRLQSMSFKDLDYLLELYKIIGTTPYMVVEKSVQCGLSELFIIQSHIEAGEMGMTIMYVLPKYELRNRFVNNRIYKLHKRVAGYNRLVIAAETKVHRTSLMHFGSGTLAYVGSNVQDEFIEIPVDSAYIDEKDRCNQANLLMLPDRLTASPYKYQREISNPTVEGFGIDERYLESSQGTWQIKCDGCGKWFVPDFWQHVVEEINSNSFAPRDQNADPDPLSGDELRLIHDCGTPVDRLKTGKWVHAYPTREWQGFKVSKVFSKFTPLRQLYRKWTKSVGNELKTQIFYNSDLGTPPLGRSDRHMGDSWVWTLVSTFM